MYLIGKLNTKLSFRHVDFYYFSIANSGQVNGLGWI